MTSHFSGIGLAMLRRSLKASILVLFLSVNVHAEGLVLCQKALKKMGICLALQSDFYDKIDLAEKYDADSECIEGVGFYDGIIPEDAKAMTKLYDLRIKTKEDPLQRSKTLSSLGDSTSYCAGEISLNVAKKRKSVSVVFSVADSSPRGRAVPEITIDL